MRRMVRLYPPFLVVLAVYIAICFLRPEFSKLPPDALGTLRVIAVNALLVQSFTGDSPIIVQTWTLGYLMAFYLAAPWIVRLFNALSLTHRRRFWLNALLTLILRLGFGHWYPWACLTAGMAAADLLPALSQLSRAWQALALAAFLSAAYFKEIPLMIFLALVLAGTSGTLLQRLLSLKFPVWVASRSYPLYLVHGLVIHSLSVLLIHRLPQTSTTFWGLQLVGLAVALVASSLFQRYIDQPLTRILMPEAELRPAPLPQSKAATWAA